MKKVFLDTNVLLDLLMDRPGCEVIKRIFHHADVKDDFRLYTSFLSIANAAYIRRKHPTAEILADIKRLMHYVNVLEMNDFQLHRLNECKSPDIEDRMQILCAETERMSIILTGNTEHFKSYTDIPVMTIAEFFGA